MGERNAGKKGKALFPPFFSPFSANTSRSLLRWRFSQPPPAKLRAAIPSLLNFFWGGGAGEAGRLCTARP